MEQSEEDHQEKDLQRGNINQIHSLWHKGELYVRIQHELNIYLEERLEYM